MKVMQPHIQQVFAISFHLLFGPVDMSVGKGKIWEILAFISLYFPCFHVFLCIFNRLMNEDLSSNNLSTSRISPRHTYISFE